MKKQFVRLLIMLLILNFACSETEETDPVDNFEFSELQIEKDTLYAGEETKVKAITTGTGLIYMWSATKGDILGSGKEIIYVSSPCHVGTNTITCTVKNESTYTETKNVDVHVLE